MSRKTLAAEYASSRVTAFPSLDLTFANVKWRLVHDCAGLDLCTDSRTSEFISQDDRPPDATVHVRWAKSFPDPGGVLFDAGLWRAYEGEPHIFDFQSPKFGATPYKRAIFDREFSEGEVLLNRELISSEKSYYPFEYPLDELAMMHRLGLGHGAELHSCGMATPDGNAFLFVGHSGAGKSTIGKLWVNERGSRILSDDRNIITRDNKGFRLHGTPWHGEAGLASNSSAELKAIFFLGRGSTNELISLPPALAAAELFARAFVPWYRAEALDFTLSFLKSVVEKVPTYTLRFVPNKHVIQFLEAACAI
jgi:hypothetical protein